MKSIFDELRSFSEARLLSEEARGPLVKINSLYRIGTITHNELRIGLCEHSIGVAGDRFAAEKESAPDRPQFD